MRTVWGSSVRGARPCGTRAQWVRATGERRPHPCARTLVLQPGFVIWRRARLDTERPTLDQRGSRGFRKIMQRRQAIAQ
ncbi:hypothetical protein GCM10010358_33170 [Streptomyces minutiscleroticus]|uniref:Uncharacterized protein n=1 Tax=Streptomyces minutiscleroticus TaxID=68238 RepID=A0A918KTM7_9ACTN|nr:hypothetical protein GCM10010358_33170 [Streptomyces minutiscleroticus]